MIIAKYNAKKQRQTVITETSVNSIVERAEQAVVQKAQQVAVDTTSEIAMTATIDMNGNLIMSTDFVVATAPVQEASQGD